MNEIDHAFPSIKKICFRYSVDKLYLSGSVLNDRFNEKSDFQLEGRYPEYISQVHRLCNDSFTKELINKTNDIRLWLISQLQ